MFYDLSEKFWLSHIFTVVHGLQCSVFGLKVLRCIYIEFVGEKVESCKGF